LHLHPSKCLNSNEYQRGKLVIGQLKVVDDSAEKNIQLIQDFNDFIYLCMTLGMENTVTYLNLKIKNINR